MFIRKSEYEGLVSRAAVALRASVDLVEAQREVRRLTDIIIAMKDRGMTADPASLDEHWGRYVMGDLPVAGDDPQPIVEIPDVRLEEREIREAERQFEAELAAQLGDE